MKTPYSVLETEGRIRSLALTAEERQRRIEELLAVADRELADAGLHGRSPDGRHNGAYAAARAAAEAVMAAEGYRRGSGEGQHAALFDFLRLVEAGRFSQEAAFFDRARRLRNVTEYERAGVISPSGADDALRAAREFVAEVRRWLQEKHGYSTST
jgi:uncharacterized protein (UPF0332 family)